MVGTARAYTPAEAAAVSEVAVKSVHNAIDKRIIATPPVGRDGRTLNDQDLLQLKLWYGVGSILSAERRKRLFDTIDQNPEADTVRADDFLIIDVARAREQLAARAEALREAEQMIQSVKGVMGGEPVFNKTRVPVRTIAAMKAQGASTLEIVEGYPSLTARMIDLAEIWAAAHPARGRPRKLSELGLKVKSTTRLPLRQVKATEPSGANS
ncbi:DUF433 domain-containing protein [Ferranicluibacter rubi]|uniref:DUF433 domain-containing protein n=1 Tax=Ferranicluibacter rubi TaxID=2715133 RepID=A0AA43ZIP5_9HYPH|nr:DUF433 domain-containing protein [Ferranicluibacter rubi]NHT77678.1 DUF433 domain-containing protein [Ferranicluibacter rubi]PYE30436.1 uncharacterized protein (DUF433 family) [Rhizobium sp. PP-WC-1G-195]TCP76488.1 uncharacterized protein (DUF433 family) [Rhizobium sp. PP-CC-2G-626]TCQ16898.1 uncharacterized protein (DUF433 family) [Rhizobium sp. PP-CC-3G-465]